MLNSTLTKSLENKIINLNSKLSRKKSLLTHHWTEGVCAVVVALIAGIAVTAFDDVVVKFDVGDCGDAVTQHTLEEVAP